jgi:hypothetical protein
MREDPIFYLRWYLLEKPYSLWDWSIHIGAGDIEFLPSTHSPYQVVPILVASKWVYRALNPFIFFLAFVSLICMVVRKPRAPTETSLCLKLVATFAIYVTLLHAALDAEPRYSIPYRPEEILLAASAAACLARKFSVVNFVRPKPRG